MVECRRAADHFPGFDVTVSAALRGDNHSVPNVAMSGDADLPGENHVLADGGGARESDLGADEGVFSDAGAVSHLDEVVDFRTVRDMCLTDAGAIDAGVGLDFDIVVENGSSGLNDFVPVSGVVFGEAESIRADDGSVLKDDVVAEFAVLANHSVRVGKEIVSDVNAFIDHNVRKQDAVVADDDPGPDDNVRADVGVLAKLGGTVHDGGGVNAGGVSGRVVEQFNCLRKCQIRILDAQRGGGRSGKAGKVLGHEHGRGASGLRHRGVLGIGDKGDVSARGLLDADDASDIGIGLVRREGIEARAKGFGQLLQRMRVGHGGILQGGSL